MPNSNEKTTLGFALAVLPENWTDGNEANKETLLKELPRNDEETEKVDKVIFVNLV